MNYTLIPIGRPLTLGIGLGHNTGTGWAGPKELKRRRERWKNLLEKEKNDRGADTYRIGMKFEWWSSDPGFGSGIEYRPVQFYQYLKGDER